MKSPANLGFSVALAAFLVGFKAPAVPSGSELLDDIIAKPGNWNQMCGGGAPIAADVPLPLYSGLATRYFFISDANRDRLRARRDDVAPEIVRRLHEFAFSSEIPKPAAAADRSFSLSESGQNPNELSGLMLDVIGEVDTVEALPELLRLEDDLNTRLAAARIGDASDVPLVKLDGDSSLVINNPNDSAKAAQINTKVFEARIFQREILSTMAVLLRHKSFAPMLKSDYETQCTAYAYLQHERNRERPHVGKHQNLRQTSRQTTADGFGLTRFIICRHIVRA